MQDFIIIIINRPICKVELNQSKELDFPMVGSINSNKTLHSHCLCTSHMYPLRSYAVLCLTSLSPPHQYRSDNKSPVSQGVGHIVILVSVGLLRQVHPSVRVPHSNLEKQTEL